MSAYNATHTDNSVNAHGRSKDLNKYLITDPLASMQTYGQLNICIHKSISPIFYVFSKQYNYCKCHKSLQ